MSAKSILRFSIIASLLLLLQSNLKAQVAGYTFTQSNNTYNAITGTDVNFTTLPWDDNAPISVNIGFSFNFNGTGYTSCRVNPNGYITFGTTTSTGSSYFPISSTTGYAGAVSAFGKDIASAGTVTYSVLNSAPNRIFVVQWKNVYRYNGTAAVNGDNLNFQIRLYETSNAAEIVYGGFTITNTNALPSQVGLRGLTNADYNNRATTTNWNATTTGGNNAASCTSSNTVLPASGLTFTWTPLTPVTINTTAVHPAAAFMGKNSVNNAVAAYKVTTGNTALTPSGFQFTTGGTYQPTTDITNYKLYQNSTNSLTGATLLQTVVASSSPQTITFNTGFTTIPSNTTVYYIIAVDVPASGQAGNTIYITANSLSNFVFTTPVSQIGDNVPALQSNTQTIIAPQVTITQNHYPASTLLQNSTDNIIASYKMDVVNDIVTPTSFTFSTAGTYIATTDVSTFKLYMNNANNLSTPTLIGTITAAGNPQTLTFNSGFVAIAAGTTRYFIITADVPLSGLNGDNVSIAATNLTNFNFTSNSGEAVIRAGANPAPASNTHTIYGPTVAIATSHPVAGNITLGTVDNLIAVYQLDVNNAVNVTPTNFTITTAGTYAAGDLINFKLYQNTAVTLTGSTLVGTVAANASGTTISFSSGFSSVPSAGTSYLILTSDVNAVATPGKNVSITNTAFTNFSFTSSGGGGVQKTGTNPATASNVHTIVNPKVAITATHPIAGSILTGSQNNLIASYKLVATDGDITPATVVLTTGGTFQGASDISIFNIYQNTSNSLTGATLIATRNISGTSSTNTLNFNTGTYLTIPSTNTSYLLVVADVAGTATAGRTVNIVAATASTANFTFTSTGSVAISGGALVVTPNQTVVSKLDVYSSGNKNWYPAGTPIWGGVTGGPYNTYVWIASGIGQLEGTAGQINITAAPSTLPVRKITSVVNSYQLVSSNSSNGITFTSPAEFSITTGTTYIGTTANNNPVLYGINGLTKTGTGELQIGAALGTGFSGSLIVSLGELTLGLKSSTTAAPYNFLKGNVINLNSSKLTIAASSGGSNYYNFLGASDLQNLSSVTVSGNSTISLYKTRTNSANYPYMGVRPTINSSPYSSANAVPLNISGQLTVDNGGSGSFTAGTYNNGYDQTLYRNYISFGSTTYSGNTTFVGYANAANVVNGGGSSVNIYLGGVGDYIEGVTTAAGAIDDNGYSTTFYGGGSSTSDGAQLCLSSSSSSMTGDWSIGDAGGVNAGWMVTNTATCLTRGSVTINNYSKLVLQLTSNVSSNITYSPATINLYGRGPANQSYYPAALDFYNFSSSSVNTSLPSNIVLNPVSNSKLSSIGVEVAGDTLTLVSFQLNGIISGSGGLEKVGPGTLILNTQNISGNYNTYQDSTRIKAGALTVNSGSNMGTGPLVMHAARNYFSSSGTTGFKTILNLNNTAQTIASLSSYFDNTTGAVGQTINLATGHILTINQNTNTVYGNNGPNANCTSIITGGGNVVKSGTGILTLTGACTYTGVTQVKDGTLQLNRSTGGTLPNTANVHITGGKLKISSNQTLNNLILSGGTLEIDNGVTLVVTGIFTMVSTSANINLNTSGVIAYGSNGTLAYGGNIQQITSAKELPVANPPKNIIFNNYSADGVQLSSNVILTGTAVAAGWVDFNGRTIGSTGSFTLNGLNNKSPKGTTTSGSSYLTNLVFTGSLEIGMSVTGAGIPANSYIVYIDPLVPNSATINNNATATASNVTFDMNLRGGLIVNLAGGIDAHVIVAGTRTYNSGANYIFKNPTTGNQIYPAFPTVGTLNYSPAYDVSIQAGTASRVVMGNAHDLEISHDLKLTSGVFVTNSNLITWSNSGGVLTSPEATYTANSLNYTNSFIATCDLSGVPLNVASATSAFAGAKGFKIKNVSNTDTYFPVGASYLTAGTAVATPSPNRMMINNQSGSPQDYTVVVNYGDIGYTNGGGGSWRVNRIWYVKSSAATGKATMRLFFTKRNWVNWGTGENEVEAGFVYAKPALVQKDYSGGYGNFINLSNAADITDFTSNALYPNDREVYAQYTIGVSTSLTNGIEQFNRFSIVNPNAIILPVSVVNPKAYKVGDKIRVDWTALNEIGIDHYEIEKSTNAATFNGIGVVKAYNNGNARNDYYFTDNNPVSGNNFYRIKIYDKDSRTSTTIIVVVNMENGKTSITVMPNPVKNKTMVVAFNNIPAGKYEAILYNANGQKVYQRVIEHIGGSASQTMNLPASLSSGSYILRVLNETTNFSTKLFIE